MDYYIQEALKEAHKSDLESKLGALIIYKGKIISRGFNFHNTRMFDCCKPFCSYVKNKFSVHAEQSAINNCFNKDILHKCRIILVKLKGKNIRHGNEVMKKCFPCEKCEKILDKYRIRKVTCYYDKVDENFNKIFIDRKLNIDKEVVELNYGIIVKMTAKKNINLIY